MQESKARGIWADEDAADERFVRFFNIIQAHAEKKGCVFFSWAGEGHEIITDELDGEDMSGWLVKKSEADEFEAQWRKDRNNVDERFARDMCVAEWSRAGEGIAISFRFWNR